MLVNATKSYFFGPIKLAIKIALFVAVLLIAGFIYLAVAVDLNTYKPQLEKSATEAMGKPVRVMGDLDWGMSGFKPSVQLNEVVIGSEKNPEATLGQLSVAIPLSDLIGGNLSADELPGKLNLNLEDLVYAGQEIGDINAPVRFNGNNLSIKPLTVNLPHDGTITADVSYQSNKLAVTAKAEGVDYALLIPGASGGDLGGTLELSSAGSTIDAVLSGLDGKVAFNGGAGRLSGDALSLWSNDLLSSILTGRKKHTDVTCLLLAGNIKNGVLVPSQAVLDTEDVLVKAKGSIDLGRQRLKLLVTPAPKDAALISLATPVNVTGAWDNPSVTPDSRAVLEKVGGLVLGAVAPPAALLAFGSTGDKSSPCAAAAQP